MNASNKRANPTGRSLKRGHRVEISYERVLIIDDSEIARATMRDALEEAGFEVYEHPSAIGCTREAMRLGIGTVVIDLNMPALRGDMLVRLFRANPRMKDVRLILVSGSPAAEIEAIAQAVRADAWVEKASLPEGLVRAVALDRNSSP